MKSRKGFTLIELIVVIAILAIIAAVAVPTAFGSIETARKAADSSTVDSMNSAVRMKAATVQLDNASNSNAALTATFKSAFDDAGLVTPAAFQSGKSKVYWVAGTNTGDVGKFVYFYTGDTAPADGVEYANPKAAYDATSTDIFKVAAVTG